MLKTPYKQPRYSYNSLKYIMFNEFKELAAGLSRRESLARESMKILLSVRRTVIVVKIILLVECYALMASGRGKVG